MGNIRQLRGDDTSVTDSNSIETKLLGTWISPPSYNFYSSHNAILNSFWSCQWQLKKIFIIWHFQRYTLRLKRRDVMTLVPSYAMQRKACANAYLFKQSETFHTFCYEITNAFSPTNIPKRSSAEFALIRFLAGVCALVVTNFRLSAERLSAQPAYEWFIAGVDDAMRFQIAGRVEGFTCNRLTLQTAFEPLTYSHLNRSWQWNQPHSWQM